MYTAMRYLISSPIKLFFHCRIKSIIEVSIFKGVLDIILHIWILAWKSRNITAIHFAWNHTSSSLLNSPDRSCKKYIFYTEYTVSEIVGKSNRICRLRVSFWGVLSMILPSFILFLTLGSSPT